MAQGRCPHERVGEHLLPPPAAAVVVERSNELEGGDVDTQGAEARHLGLEVLELRGRGGQYAVRQRPAVEELERAQLAAQARGQAAHRPHPVVLERVVLRLGEHVQAEHGFEQRRVPERQARLLVLGQVEADRDARP